MGRVMQKPIRNSDNMPKEAGVYAIVCPAKKKVYVGQSKNIFNRMRWHNTALSHNKHPCADLQKDFNSGLCVFVKTLKLLDEVNHNLLVLEDYYIICFMMRNIKLYNKEKEINVMRDYFRILSMQDETLRNVFTQSHRKILTTKEIHEWIKPEVWGWYEKQENQLECHKEKLQNY